MNQDLQSAAVTFLLGGGLTALIGALAKGLVSLRSGARAYEREAVADLARARDEADERCRIATADGDYWHAIAGRYLFQLVKANIDPNPPDPVPPSERGQAAS